MSFQVCSCGWSKVTTYQGLRIHQGKKGCTPKGMRIPESEQFRYNSHVPQMTFAVPTIKMPEHFEDLLSSLTKSEAEQNMWINVWGTHRGESRPNANREPRIQESEQLRFNRVVPQLALPRPPIREAEPLFTPLTKPGPPVREAEPLVEVFPTFTLSEGMNNIQLHRREDSRQRESRLTDNAPVKHENVFSSLSNPTIPEARITQSLQMTKPFINNQQQSLQTGFNSDKSNGVLDVNSGAQTLSMSLAPLTLGTSMNLGTPLNLGSHLNLGTPAKSAAAEVVLEATNQQLFQTPPPAFNTTSRARRTLDFHTGAVQLEQQIGFNTPTTASQERQQKQKDRERQRKEQQLAKERHDAIRADLQLKIQMIEIKMAEVKLSSKQCKVSLDTEWLEINNVFSDVMRDVEEARDKALQPLEERRHRVKRETEVFVEKLEKETDQLKKAIEELEQNQDLQVSPLTCLDDSWKTVTVDTSFSFGTLRTTTSNMIKNIQKKLEQLSSTELRRTSKFEVDVKLDPATAHPFLELSRDGKKVTEGGKDQRVPYSPERFDMFGSVLGLNRFPSGKSYWEVEVRNKTGWDLGVARGDANRKGKLTLTPDNGYWVTVHYENEKYAAMATPPTSLALTEKPQKVGVFVDYEEGLVSFYNVMAKSHIYSFTGCLFNGEIVPYFSPHLKENGKNSAPLIISAVN
uniref:E3 ubiquitin-protein ligase TRIM21-like n=1 Tax=Labrus bergylta TaxID=56723 RepID=A0A3Q3E7U7_9LABR|nr:E3 ubiquitin-protein ligase TRIM21-like isoform X1 [Labrus bergylta]XP_020504461.1 E3 ubiquitin-protein ligase TRIM21-like isoform X1 [Labrus bergylta]